MTGEARSGRDDAEAPCGAAPPTDAAVAPAALAAPVAPVDEAASVAPDPEPADYASAVAELETIVSALERDDLDVDKLSARVARGAALLRWCRARLGATQLEVERIVADLDPDARTR
ncbi:MAG: exodeoxyribonuclease VII small subunit [Actinobacteria bacterium]|nr:exodeoxyribonuclease VII small subunit [Actinomycetota bacterium]